LNLVGHSKGCFIEIGFICHKKVHQEFIPTNDVPCFRESGLMKSHVMQHHHKVTEYFAEISRKHWLKKQYDFVSYMLLYRCVHIWVYDLLTAKINHHQPPFFAINF